MKTKKNRKFRNKTSRIYAIPSCDKDIKGVIDINGIRNNINPINSAIINNCLFRFSILPLFLILFIFTFVKINTQKIKNFLSFHLFIQITKKSYLCNEGYDIITKMYIML